MSVQDGGPTSVPYVALVERSGYFGFELFTVTRETERRLYGSFGGWHRETFVDRGAVVIAPATDEDLERVKSWRAETHAREAAARRWFRERIDDMRAKHARAARGLSGGTETK